MKKFENIIIASDLDGTFLSDDLCEVARNVEKIRYFTENGGTFIFATGRIGVHVLGALPNSPTYVNHPIVSCNGMQLFDLKKGAAVKKSLVDPELHYETITYLMKRYPNTFYRAISENGVLSFQMDHRFALEEIAEKSVDYIYAEPEAHKDFDVYKLTLRDEPEVLDEIKELVEERYGDKYDVCKSWCDLMELMPKGYSKAVLLAEVKADLSKNGEKILYAVGDHENDLEMLGIADVAVCPANAIDEVKAICDYCFCDNDHGVIADLIEFIDKE